MLSKVIVFMPGMIKRVCIFCLSETAKSVMCLGALPGLPVVLSVTIQCDFVE